MHVLPMQFVRPEITIEFDFDAHVGRVIRPSILDKAAADRLRVAGMHIGFFRTSDT